MADAFTIAVIVTPGPPQAGTNRCPADGGMFCAGILDVALVIACVVFDGVAR
jgi:hypothetical protein